MGGLKSVMKLKLVGIGNKKTVHPLIEEDVRHVCSVAIVSYLLGIALGYTERSCSATTLTCSVCSRKFDGAESLFILNDVVLKSEKQTLCMFGSKYDTALYVSLGYTRKYADEIHYNFCA